MNPFTHALLSCALLFLTLKELTEACSCFPSHPQQQFCNADVVIRVKVMSEEIPKSDSPDSTIKYEVKMTQIFKGSNKIKDEQHVYTPLQSATCGVKLDIKKEYIISGTIRDGNVHIYLCGFITLWVDVTEFQRNSISQAQMGYQSGCECKIKICGMTSCNELAPNECPLLEEEKQTLNAQHACIKSRDGSCSWHPSLPQKSTHTTHP